MAKTILAIAAAAASLSAAAYAEAPSRSVSYADLDLTRSAGAHAVLQRIENAASGVCGGAPTIAALAMTAAYDDCVAMKVGNAVADLDEPLVTSIFEGAYGHVEIARN